VAALVAERALLGSVLDGMSQGVIALDGACRMTLTSRRRARPRSVGGAGGRGLHRSGPHPGGGVADRAPRQRGGRRVLDRRRRPGAGPGGAAAGGDGCILALEDVTAMRRLEPSADFVANVSHELRTLVSVIRANAET
jgi:signal transduction histidine kinase